jgi:hypothetical protein
MSTDALVCTPPIPAAPRSWWWVVVGAVLLPCVYLPTLNTPFDFIDDGNLVYPAPPMPLPQRVELVWQKIVANYEHLGPFRPTLWVHWEVEAELFRGSPFCWRLARLLWMELAAGMMLWLMRELRIHPVAALLATAVALWNPYRNEIWTSLSLAEGVAMPYALLALVCAVRAARSSRPWVWDLVGVACVLTALGCKNTFAALVPAQVLLRIAPDGVDWLDGLRRRGWRAALLALTLLAPAAHFVYFKLHWHAGQYKPGSPTLAQAGRLARGLVGAMSLDALGAGLALLAVALLVARLVRSRRNEDAPTEEGVGTGGKYRGALLAGAALVAAGVAVYLPMGMVSGRYTMPAVWGLDLTLAVLFSLLCAAPRSFWKGAAFLALGAGLVVVAVMSVGKQEKFAARARVLWQALEWVEREAPADARVGWVSELEPSVNGAERRPVEPSLNVEEGIHFHWHLLARGRGDVRVVLLDDDGRPRARRELEPVAGDPSVIVTAAPKPPPFHDAAETQWQMRPFRATYWAGYRSYECCVWTASEAQGRSTARRE